MRIWADFATFLIRRVNILYSDEPLEFNVNIKGNDYAPGSGTIDLSMDLFELSLFLLYQGGNQVTYDGRFVRLYFIFIHISDAKMGNANVLGILPIQAGDLYISDWAILTLDG